MFESRSISVRTNSYVSRMDTEEDRRSGPVLTACTSTYLIDLLQLVVPEQLPIAVVESDIESGVAEVSPSLGDGPLLAPQVHLAMGLSDPHPLADLRFFGLHEDLTPSFPVR